MPEQAPLDRAAGPTVDVVVIGAGIAGLIAARECAKVGLSVRLLGEVTAGPTRTIELAGVGGIDAGAETFAVGDMIDQLASEFGVPTEILLPRNTLLATARVTAPIPQQVIAGLPGNPLSAELKPFLGGARARAYADRVMPFLTIGKAHNLAALARGRFGLTVLERFTDPYARAVYQLPAERIDVDRAAPRLNTTLTSLGSVSGAVLALSEEPSAPSCRAVGGLEQLWAALRARLEQYLVECLPIRARELRAVTDASPARWVVTDVDGQQHWCHAVIATVDPAELGGDRAASVEALSSDRLIVTAALRTRSGQSGNASGVLFDPDAGPALELGIQSASLLDARSTSLAAQCPAGIRLLRVVADARQRNDDERAALVSFAAETLGFSSVQIEASDQFELPIMRPWVGLGDPPSRPDSDSERSAVEAGCVWAGQWVVGPGLARAAESGYVAAHRLRSEVLRTKLGSET